MIIVKYHPDIIINILIIKYQIWSWLIIVIIKYDSDILSSDINFSLSTNYKSEVEGLSQRSATNSMKWNNQHFPPSVVSPSPPKHTQTSGISTKFLNSLLLTKIFIIHSPTTQCIDKQYLRVLATCSYRLYWLPSVTVNTYQVNTLQNQKMKIPVRLQEAGERWIMMRWKYPHPQTNINKK